MNARSVLLAALALLGACASTGPVRPSDPREAARQAMDEGRVADVAALLGPIADAGQAGPDDLVLLGEAWLRRGDGQRAYQAAAAALQRDATHVRANRIAGEAAYLLGQHAVALEHLDAAAAGGDDDPELLVLLARLRLETGPPAAAIEAARRATAATPGAEAQITLGLALTKAGDTKGAKAAFEAAVAADPEDAAAHYHLGNLLAATGELEGADASYRAALEKDPMMVDAMRNLGSVLVMRDQADEAARLLGKALRLAPDSPELLNNLGVALTRAGNEEDAAMAFTQAVEHAPDQTAIRTNAADALARMGRLDDAARLLSEAPPEAVAEVRLSLGHMIVARELAAGRCAGVTDTAATRARVTGGLQAAGFGAAETRALVEAVVADPDLLLAIERATANCGK